MVKYRIYYSDGKFRGCLFDAEMYSRINTRMWDGKPGQGYNEILYDTGEGTWYLLQLSHEPDYGDDQGGKEAFDYNSHVIFLSPAEAAEWFEKQVHRPPKYLLEQVKKYEGIDNYHEFIDKITMEELDLPLPKSDTEIQPDQIIQPEDYFIRIKYFIDIAKPNKSADVIDAWRKNPQVKPAWNAPKGAGMANHYTVGSLIESCIKRLDPSIELDPSDFISSSLSPEDIAKLQEKADSALMKYNKKQTKR